jgi:hypothetical protein
MRERILIFVGAAILATIGSRIPAATFQNMDFEAYPAGAAYPASGTMPSWQLVNQLGNGTVLYQNSQPGVFYPFVGYHIGNGPVIGVNGVSAQFPNQLQGQYSLTLIPYKDSSVFYPTESAAQAALDNAQHGGLAQTADVPPWAQSVWVATTTQSPSDMNMTFSGHPVTLGAATNVQASAMLALASTSPGLAFPLMLPPNNPSVHYLAGNISSIAGLTRELKILSGRGSVISGASPSGTDYFASTPSVNFDMIVFSPLPWAGPAVDVPEPHAILILLTAIPALLMRRRGRLHSIFYRA